MNRIARITGLLLLGAVFGLIAGVYIGFAYLGRPMRAMSALMTAAWAGQLAHNQYQHAGYAEARQALLHYVSVLNALAATPEYEMGRTAHSDIGLTYARLAVLESSHGNQAESARFLGLAVDAARKGGWREPTPERLRAFVEKLDGPRPTPVPTPPGA